MQCVLSVCERCTRCAVSTLPLPLALALHQLAAADSHPLQTPVRLHVCSVCLPDSVALGACVYASRDPCVCQPYPCLADLALTLHMHCALSCGC